MPVSVNYYITQIYGRKELGGERGERARRRTGRRHRARGVTSSRLLKLRSHWSKVRNGRVKAVLWLVKISQWLVKSCALIGRIFSMAGWKLCADWSNFLNGRLKALRWLVEFFQWMAWGYCIVINICVWYVDFIYIIDGEWQHLPFPFYIKQF